MPRLHLVTDDRVLADPGFAARARQALEASDGRVALHVRGPGTPARALYDQAVALLPAARRAGALLVVNDRVDVALAAGASAVQLGGRSLELATVLGLRDRGLLAADLRVGVSVHGAPEAREAAGAHWLLVGTIFDTPSHPGVEGAGPALLQEVAGAADAPLVAIGGMTPGRVAEVVGRGAHGVAALRSVWAPSRGSTAEAVRDYLQALDTFTRSPT